MDSRCDDVRLSFLNATRCFILPLSGCRAERGAANAGLAAQPLAWGYAECGARGPGAGGRGRKAGWVSAERWWDDSRCAGCRCNVWLPMLRLQRLGTPIVRVSPRISSWHFLAPPLPPGWLHCSETHGNSSVHPRPTLLHLQAPRVPQPANSRAANRLDTRCLPSSRIPAVQPSGVPAALALRALPAKGAGAPPATCLRRHGCRQQQAGARAPLAQLPRADHSGVCQRHRPDRADGAGGQPWM